MRCDMSINDKGTMPVKNRTMSQCWDFSSWWSEVVKAVMQWYHCRCEATCSWVLSEQACHSKEFFVTCLLGILGSHAFTVSTCFIPQSEWLRKASPQATCFVFMCVHCSLIFFGYVACRDNDALRVLMLWSEGAGERFHGKKIHSFPWNNFRTVKKDVPVVSFNLVRPAAVLMYAVCSFCCYGLNR